MALDLKTCNICIVVFGLITIAIGVVVGHLFHNGENELMFVPLGIGFVFLCITYFFVEKSYYLVSGKTDEF